MSGPACPGDTHVAVLLQDLVTEVRGLREDLASALAVLAEAEPRIDGLESY